MMPSQIKMCEAVEREFPEMKRQQTARIVEIVVECFLAIKQDRRRTRPRTQEEYEEARRKRGERRAEVERIAKTITAPAALAERETLTGPEIAAPPDLRLR
jgi:hypothetical protein